MTAQPGDRIGIYLVERELGRGGMGAVYLVRHPQLPRPLALKLVLPDASPEAVLRFGREAQLMARVQHPHVVRVHQVGRADQGPFIVTELVEGQGLDRLLKERGPLDPARAARVVRALADAAGALHAAGIVHRDLKPENVILRPDDHPVLLDFGVARDESAERLTRTGQLVGTPSYMSPEQAEGDRAREGPQSDVYGLGAILYALLVGRPPFAGPFVQVMKKILLEDPAWPADLRLDVPVELECVLKKAMGKDLAERYPTAAALRDDLDRFLGGDEPLAVGALPTPRRRARRRAIAGLSGSLLVLLGAVLLLASGVAYGFLGRTSTTTAEQPSGPLDVTPFEALDGAEFTAAAAAFSQAHAGHARLKATLAELRAARVPMDAARLQLEDLRQKEVYDPQLVRSLRTSLEEWRVKSAHRYPRLAARIEEQLLALQPWTPAVLASGSDGALAVAPAGEGRIVLMRDRHDSKHPQLPGGVALWSLSLDPPAAAPLRDLLLLEEAGRAIGRKDDPAAPLCLAGLAVLDGYAITAQNPRWIKQEPARGPDDPVLTRRLWLLPLRGGTAVPIDLPPGQLGPRPYRHPDGPLDDVMTLAACSERSLLAIGFRDGRVQVLPLGPLTQGVFPADLVQVVCGPRPGRQVNDLVFLEGGQRLAAALGEDIKANEDSARASPGAVEVWELGTTPPRSWSTPFTGKVEFLAEAPDRRHFVAASAVNFEMPLFDAARPEPIAYLVSPAAVAANERFYGDAYLGLMDFSRSSHGSAPQAGAFSSDGRRFYSASGRMDRGLAPRELRVWEFRDGDLARPELVRCLVGWPGEGDDPDQRAALFYSALSVGPDRLLLTARKGPRLTLWRFPATSAASAPAGQ